jgi:hypothetical protein
MVVGGFEHLLNLYSVDHAPNPIHLTGMIDIGLGLGVGWTPGRYKCFSSVQIRTDDVVTQPLAQLSHYRAFGCMRLAEFRGNAARLSTCGAKPVRTER